jgi:hypothetical protein
LFLAVIEDRLGSGPWLIVKRALETLDAIAMADFSDGLLRQGDYLSDSRRTDAATQL